MTVASNTREFVLRWAATIGGPGRFLREIGWNSYLWQDDVYAHYLEPTMVVAARQVGKTQCFGGLAYFVARTVDFSLSAIACPDQDKSKTMIKRVKEVGRKEDTVWEPDNTEELGLGGSRILGLPGTVKGVVSNAAKLLVFDEAGLMLGQIGRDLYSAATPMQGHVEQPLTFAISSAWWQEGWFFEEWDHGSAFRKVLVRPKYDMVKREIVPALIPEEEFKKQWLAKGVNAFYSDYPTKEFLEAEMKRHTERHMRQQYFCEFLERQGKIFTSAWIDKAVTKEVKPLFSGPVEPTLQPAGIIAEAMG